MHSSIHMSTSGIIDYYRVSLAIARVVCLLFQVLKNKTIDLLATPCLCRVYSWIFIRYPRQCVYVVFIRGYMYDIHGQWIFVFTHGYV